MYLRVRINTSDRPEGSRCQRAGARFCPHRLFSHCSNSRPSSAGTPSVAGQLLHRTDVSPERSKATSLSFTRTEAGSVSTCCLRHGSHLFFVGVDGKAIAKCSLPLLLFLSCLRPFQAALRRAPSIGGDQTGGNKQLCLCHPGQKDWFSL